MLSPDSCNSISKIPKYKCSSPQTQPIFKPPLAKFSTESFSAITSRFFSLALPLLTVDYWKLDHPTLGIKFEFTLKFVNVIKIMQKCLTFNFRNSWTLPLTKVVVPSAITAILVTPTYVAIVEVLSWKQGMLILGDIVKYGYL